MAEAPGLNDPRLDGIGHQVVTHGTAASVEEAASLRGVAVSAVVKTMVVRRSVGDYLFVLVPGDRVIDWPKLRAHLGKRRLSMAGADEALEVTGYVRGTITPLASAARLQVVADERLVEGQVSIGAGAPGVSVTLAGEDLVVLFDADVADVTRSQG